MKNLIFTLLVMACMAFSKDAVCGPIVTANCLDWMPNQQCLQPKADGTTDVVIVVDFSTIPWWEDYNWFVYFSPSPPAAVKYFYKNDAHEKVGKKYTFNHSFPLGNYASSSFFVSLQTPRYFLSRVNPGPYYPGFDLCRNTNKLSSPNSLIDSKIYPNPIVKEFTVEYQAIKNEEVTFEVFDINGSLVYATKFRHQDNGLYSKQINNLNLIKGIYFCRIENAESQKTIKITQL